MKSANIKKEHLFALLEPHYELIYVNYDEDLYERLEDLQEAIQGDSTKLYDIISECYDDYESIQYILDNNLPREIKDKYKNFTNDEIEELIEHFEDDLRGEIRDRDSSQVLTALIKNTGKLVLFYDTGVELEWNDNIDENVKIIKKALHIKLKDETYDKQLQRLISNAYYGGRLVIYFNDKANDWMDVENTNLMIKFTNPQIALIDNGNGSGNDEEFSGLKIAFPFDRKNLFIDKATHYSYVYDVCGMDDDFCDNTKVTLYEKRKNNKKKIEKSSLHEHLDQEKEYDKIYKAGKCSFGDMNSSRHRNVEYINDFPCGSKCKDCGTFWID